MTFPQGAAFVLCIGIGFIGGLLLDEIAWGLIIGAAAGVLIEAFGGSRRNRP